jgi:hypothetical protein
MNFTGDVIWSEFAHTVQLLPKYECLKRGWRCVSAKKRRGHGKNLGTPWSTKERDVSRDHTDGKCRVKCGRNTRRT